MKHVYCQRMVTGTKRNKCRSETKDTEQLNHASRRDRRANITNDF